jgi:hypothetical protein
MIAFAWCHTALLHHKGGYLIWSTSRQPLREVLLYWVIQAKETTSCAPRWGIARYTAPISPTLYQQLSRYTDRLRTGRPGFDSRQEKYFISSVQDGYGTHPASYPLDPGGLFHKGKAAGAWSWPLIFIYCRGQLWSYTCIPQHVSTAWYLVN